MSALPSVPLPWLLGGSIVGYLLVIFTNPVRASLRDGLRCVRRYSVAVAHARGVSVSPTRSSNSPCASISTACCRRRIVRPDLGARGLARSRISGSPVRRNRSGICRRMPCAQAVVETCCPPLESVAGIFNLLVTTFPLSAFAAFLFFINWENHHAVLCPRLAQALRLLGLGCCTAASVICALAALAKPLLYAAPLLLGLQPPAAAAWFQWAPVAEWLSFLFEYLAGVCVQIGLILVAYCWVRGLSFTHQHLIDFAIRRFSFVVRWALLVMLLSSLLIHVPLILKNFAAFQALFPPDEAVVRSPLDDRARGAHRGVAALCDHADHAHFSQRIAARRVPRSWRFVAAQLVAAAAGFSSSPGSISISCAWRSTLVQRGLGDGTALGIAWSLLAPWLNGLVAAWLLASWVCFYRHRTPRACRSRAGVLEQGVLF